MNYAFNSSGVYDSTVNLYLVPDGAVVFVQPDATYVRSDWLDVRKLPRLNSHRQLPSGLIIERGPKRGQVSRDWQKRVWIEVPS